MVQFRIHSFCLVHQAKARSPGTTLWLRCLSCPILLPSLLHRFPASPPPLNHVHSHPDLELLHEHRTPQTSESEHLMCTLLQSQSVCWHTEERASRLLYLQVELLSHGQSPSPFSSACPKLGLRLPTCNSFLGGPRRFRFVHNSSLPNNKSLIY